MLPDPSYQLRRDSGVKGTPGLVCEDIYGGSSGHWLSSGVGRACIASSMDPDLRRDDNMDPDLRRDDYMDPDLRRDDYMDPDLRRDDSVDYRFQLYNARLPVHPPTVALQRLRRHSTSRDDGGVRRMRHHRTGNLGESVHRGGTHYGPPYRPGGRRGHRCGIRSERQDARIRFRDHWLAKR